MKKVFNTIKFFKPVKELEGKCLLGFIDIVVEASLVLKYLGRESERKKSTIILIIERKFRTICEEMELKEYMTKIGQ